MVVPLQVIMKGTPYDEGPRDEGSLEEGSLEEGPRHERSRGAGSHDEGFSDARPSSDREGRSGTTPGTWRATDTLNDLASAVTSRPSPARFSTCYSSLAAAGATAVVSIHLSGQMSGTIESARLAARDAPVPVEVIDSRSIAMGLGYPVLAAARAAAAEGASLETVAAAARRCAEATQTFFYVDTLEYLRRSGRIGAAASVLGSALMIKPLLHIVNGQISLLEKVRTATRAIARLEDLAVQAAGAGPVEVAVQHLAARARAEALAERLPKRVPGLMDLRVVEVGPVIGAHVGPGMLGLTVTPRDVWPAGA
ncbi:DegV family protein with EDD domain [Nonomuraea polychroma]|uniref:DegV family protein with EDD domain n=2 Tax=Nonomuraea polychroma TaxID=46176 RepID=A0A438LXD9_9ACTN|nr:DegV family protein with EDD domain [Nonomuraea polychroma]